MVSLIAVSHGFLVWFFALASGGKVGAIIVGCIGLVVAFLFGGAAYSIVDAIAVLVGFGFAWVQISKDENISTDTYPVNNPKVAEYEEKITIPKKEEVERQRQLEIYQERVRQKDAQEAVQKEMAERARKNRQKEIRRRSVNLALLWYVVSSPIVFSVYYLNSSLDFGLKIFFIALGSLFLYALFFWLAYFVKMKDESRFNEVIYYCALAFLILAIYFAYV